MDKSILSENFTVKSQCTFVQAPENNKHLGLGTNSAPKSPLVDNDQQMLK